MVEYKGHEITVTREQKQRRFELFCQVDGKRVVSATEIERRGAKGPEDGGYAWTPQLRRYCEGYVDGIES